MSAVNNASSVDLALWLKDCMVPAVLPTLAIIYKVVFHACSSVVEPMQADQLLLQM